MTQTPPDHSGRRRGLLWALAAAWIVAGIAFATGTRPSRWILAPAAWLAAGLVLLRLLGTRRGKA